MVSMTIANILGSFLKNIFEHQTPVWVIVEELDNLIFKYF